MDVLFFVFFQAMVRAVARDPTNVEALKPVLGLEKKPQLADLGALEKCFRNEVPGTALCADVLKVS